MGTLRRLTHLQMGIHTSGSDWTATPGSLKHVAPEGVEIVTDYEPIERPLEAGDGENFSALQGAKIGQLNGLVVPFRGLSGSGAGDGVAASSLDTNIVDELLEAIFGRAPRDGTGDTTDGADAGTGTSCVLDGDPGAALGVGDALLVKGTTSGKYYPRFVVSESTATMTMCRALTTDVNGADTPDESAVVYAGRVFQLDAANGNHTHVYADAEDLIARRTLNGGLGSASIRATGGGYLALVLGTIDFTDWAAPATASPTYSAPTQGNHIKVFDCPLWIGSDLYMASNVALDIGLRLERRMSDGAPNGFWGHVADGFAPTLTFDLHYGSITAPKEADDTFLATLQGESTQDILVQWGRGATQCVAARMPDADVRARIVVEGGQKKVRVTAIGTRPAGGSAAGELGALQVAIF